MVGPPQLGIVYGPLLASIDALPRFLGDEQGRTSPPLLVFGSEKDLNRDLYRSPIARSWYK